ncbi:MAG: phosphoribulokinase [Actinomycetota bacterium]|nr:phosphoribulokinase [Actinomycetota bacterium]
MPHKKVMMQRADPMPDRRRPVMLAIAGDSAAGKTTLTRGLVAALGGDNIASMCVDDYHAYDRTERKGLPFTPLNPACNYMDIMEQHLQLLATGEPVLKPVYNHQAGTLDRPVLFTPTENVIVEGLLPLHSRMARACFDLSVFLDPPEDLRVAWKLKRDTGQRGYDEAQVRQELERRAAESAAFIRPQRRHADIVVRFAPIEERDEHKKGLLSATVLLRPTVSHPDLSQILTEDTRQAIHLKLMRDEDGKPVDALHIHAYADRQTTRKVEEAIWGDLGIEQALPVDLGIIEGHTRSEPLAVVQLILLYHLLVGRRADEELQVTS